MNVGTDCKNDFMPATLLAFTDGNQHQLYDTTRPGLFAGSTIARMGN
jgi:hypothetical protein